MHELFRKSRSSAGSRPLKTKLNDEGVIIGRFKVRRLMQEMNLVSKQPGATDTSRVLKNVQIYRTDLTWKVKIRFGAVILPIFEPAVARRDIGNYLMDYYNRVRPHAHNVGLAPAIAEEKLKKVSGIS